MPPFFARHANAAVAVAFLLAGLATLPDHGLTWDGPESYRAGARNLAIVAAAVGGEPLPSWPWHELPGYQFLADTLRAALAGVANGWFWEPGSYRGFHLVNLLLAALVVASTGRLAAREGGVPVLGPLAATLLVLQPKLVGHAMANPKDIPGLVVWLLAALALTRAARTGAWRDFALLGAALGLAGATHATTALLVPLALGWVAFAGAGPFARRLGGLALAGAVAAPVGVLLWPWLWAAPLRRALYLLRHLGDFDVDMKVLYLGSIWSPAALPWHYGVVSLAIATPVALLLAAAAGLATARRGSAGARGSVAARGSGEVRDDGEIRGSGETRGSGEAPAGGEARGSGGTRGDLVARDSVGARAGGSAPPAPSRPRLARFAALWLGLVLAADLAAPARYDGARHLLPALPALALLGAVGVEAAGRMAISRWRRRSDRRGPGTATRADLAGGLVATAGATAVAALLIAHAVSLARVHPYADAWLSPAARLWLGPEAQRRVELEYWGASYAEGCSWLAANAPPGSRVLVPIASHVAAPCLAGRFELVPHDGLRDASRPRYLMLMAREAWYTPRLREVVATREPVFAVRRQGSTLLAVYRL